MERFTYKNGRGMWTIGCKSFLHWFELKLPTHLHGDAVDRLAAYENTGLDPEKLKEEYCAEWEYCLEENTAICSKCKNEHYMGTYRQYAKEHCPNCGRKMLNASEYK